jgi:hypothetical protein
LAFGRIFLFFTANARHIKENFQNISGQQSTRLQAFPHCFGEPSAHTISEDRKSFYTNNKQEHDTSIPALG